MKQKNESEPTAVPDGRKAPKGYVCAQVVHSGGSAGRVFVKKTKKKRPAPNYDYETEELLRESSLMTGHAVRKEKYD